MQAEIITVGDEIVSGNIVDTNKAYLSDKLWAGGIKVVWHTSVRDDAADIKAALLLANQRADIVLVSGGLGPTADDFTLEIAAKTFRKKMVRHQPTLNRLETLMKKLGRTLHENNKKQADVPEGADVFDNKWGTAPGIGITFKKKRYYFLPGVPREMKQLFEDSVFAEIIQNNPDKKIFVSKFLKCFGTSEADLDLALKELYSGVTEINNVRVGFRAQFPETTIKLSAWDKTEENAVQALAAVEDQVRQKIGEAIYGEGEDTLEKVVGELLNKSKKTLALAESCTGGLIASRVTNVPGSSAYFLGGAVSYSNESKVKLLGVSEATLKTHGAVSSQCAIEMAQGIRRQLKSDYGIAVTGIAGPSGGSVAKPVGTVYVALASPNGTKEKLFNFPRNRDMFKLLVSSIALNWLRKELIVVR
ncbi:competence/damage-inducible protein A [bacterium]|nr:competence/damage-inducible protein A [bacterium]